MSFCGVWRGSGKQLESVVTLTLEKLDGRQRLEFHVYYHVLWISTIVWWILIVPVNAGGGPNSTFESKILGLFQLGDAVYFVFLPFVIATASNKIKSALPLLVAIQFGGSIYALLATFTMATRNSEHYFGLLAMILAGAVSFAWTLRLPGLPLLWGPFEFRMAEPAQSLFWGTAKQVIAMWSIFLGVLPFIVVQLELANGWNQLWFSWPWSLWIGAALFVAGGTLGLTSAAVMIRKGDGTPLPATCAKRLVIDGPYRWIRNPMAIGGIIQVTGIAVAVGSPFVLLFGLIGAIWWEILARPEEETYLKNQFGEKYEQYRRRVRCWIPFPKRGHSKK